MIYILCALLVGLYSTLIIKFWHAVYRFGKWKKTLPAEPHMFGMDGVSLFCALMVPYWAAQDWFGFSLPYFQRSPLESWESILMAVACTTACVTIGYLNGRQRFTAPTHAGINEAALRFLATRQIITAAEVSHALKKQGHLSIETDWQGGRK